MEFPDFLVNFLVKFFDRGHLPGMCVVIVVMNIENEACTRCDNDV